MRTKTECSATAQGLAGELTMHVHHPRGGAVLRRGHLGATLLIFALFLVLVLLEEKMEQKPSHHMACACVSKPLGGGMNILFSQFISGACKSLEGSPWPAFEHVPLGASPAEGRILGLGINLPCVGGQHQQPCKQVQRCQVRDREDTGHTLPLPVGPVAAFLKEQSADSQHHSGRPGEGGNPKEEGW